MQVSNVDYKQLHYVNYEYKLPQSVMLKHYFDVENLMHYNYKGPLFRNVVHVYPTKEEVGRHAHIHGYLYKNGEFTRLPEHKRPDFPWLSEFSRPPHYGSFGTHYTQDYPNSIALFEPILLKDTDIQCIVGIKKYDWNKLRYLRTEDYTRHSIDTYRFSNASNHFIASILCHRVWEYIHQYTNDNTGDVIDKGLAYNKHIHHERMHHKELSSILSVVYIGRKDGLINHDIYFSWCKETGLPFPEQLKHTRLKDDYSLVNKKLSRIRPEFKRSHSNLGLIDSIRHKKIFAWPVPFQSYATNNTYSNWVLFNKPGKSKASRPWNIDTPQKRATRRMRREERKGRLDKSN